jgi:hypothetical protein
LLVDLASFEFSGPEKPIEIIETDPKPAGSFYCADFLFLLHVNPLDSANTSATVLLMKRGSKNTVTDEAKLPVLVPCSAAEMEGFATFGPEDGPPQTVRIFVDADLKKAKKHLPGLALQRWVAVMKLKQALESPDDSMARQDALRALDEVDQLLRSGAESPLRAPIPPEVPANLVEDFAHGKYSPQMMIELMEHNLGLRPGPHAKTDPGWLLSYVLSMELREARLVLWWRDKSFRPALWCPDMKTAWYARALLKVVGGKGFCICPHCGAWFVQDRPDQIYCKVSHREAYRVARWREQKKQNATEKGNKRRINGAEKTG